MSLTEWKCDSESGCQEAKGHSLYVGAGEKEGE